MSSKEYTPAGCVWKMRGELIGRIGVLDGAPGVDGVASRAALRRMTRDLRQMYPKGHPQRERTLMDGGEVQAWTRALLYHPHGYGNTEGWGYVGGKVCVDHERISKSLGGRLSRYAVELVGGVPLDECEAYLGSHGPLHPHVVSHLQGNGQGGIQGHIEAYKRLQGNGDLAGFMAYLQQCASHEENVRAGKQGSRSGPEKGSRQDDDRRPVTLYVRTLRGAYPIVLTAYLRDHPEIARKVQDMQKAFASVVADVLAKLNGGVQRDDLLHHLRVQVHAVVEQWMGVADEENIDGLIHELAAVIPDASRVKGLRKRSADTPEVRARFERAQRWYEGRADDTYGVERAVNSSKVNPFVRVVPVHAGIARSLHPKDPSLSSVDRSSHHVHRDLGLFYRINAEKAQHIAFRVAEAIRSNTELVIFIPTCPCDPICATGNGNDQHIIRFTGGPLVDGISWTGLNTVDGATIILSKLLKANKDLRVRVVYATGDFEYYNGSTRGMSENDYREQLSANHVTLGNYLRDKWHLVSHEGQGKRPLQIEETRGVSLHSADKRIYVDINGLMAFAGGREKWREVENGVRKNVLSVFADAQRRQSLMVLARSRAGIYQKLRKVPDLSDAQLLDCLYDDVVSYCAAHHLSRRYDKTCRRSIVLAGDSRPMEELAAEIEGTILLLVAGGYKGS